MLNLASITKPTWLITTALLSLNLLQQASAAPNQIRLNQLGFTPESTKTAVINNTDSQSFSIIDIASGKSVYQGQLSQSALWPSSGETVKLAKFDDFTNLGRYHIQVKELEQSLPFTIDNSRYQQPLIDVIRAYYFNRSGAVIQKKYAGKYARPAAHPDTIVYVHESAATEARPAGTVISSPKGWYDAGDYNKYIVNSNISVYTLLSALTEHENALESLKLNIPESSNNLPDFVDEILWNIDWMLTMQDPNDGGLYHKLTTKRFTGETQMPHHMDQPRYVVAKSTAASLGYAATMAKASTVLAKYEQQLPGYSQKLLTSAKQAWQWALINPAIHYEQPADIATGAYATAGDDLKDEWLWAKSELFAATGDKQYLADIAFPENLRIPEWDKVETLALFTFASNLNTPADIRDHALLKLTTVTNKWLTQGHNSAYGVAITPQDFVWGSNSNMLNKAIMLLRVNQLQANPEYVHQANAIVDYIFGRNPLGMSYVTGVGQHTPMHIHHRVSMADGITEPIPGFLVGGPQPGQQDAEHCTPQGGIYASTKPALSYIDHGCSYASNEVTINWNAALVYALAALTE
ncbi:glycoside hydrolase family 9 protein [Shewanella donghaensis]|uniref:glycoside hydrolase family 9 protein n=1 Tax=Shewanella donghaensis TaxID=238836 RepID=UPI001182A63C|nr:glycoside hydrolase family 9 protein [Shewanella donghaensis]